ncbi:MAG: RodZ domain-containing protein [Pseudomonadota bacterium]
MDRYQDRDTLERPGPGRRLAEERRRQGLSVADLGRQLKLTPRQVEALEADDYERLPGNTFVRGFIRNYAKALHLDPEPLLAELEERLPEERPSAILPPIENIPFASGKEGSWQRYLLLAGLVLLVIPWLLYEAYRQQPLAPPPTPEVALPVPPPTAVEPGVFAGASSSGNAPASPPDPVASVAGAAPLAAAGAEAQAPAPQEPAPSPAPGSVRLVFKKEAWVEIRDRDGQVLLSRINPAGTEQRVEGTPPFSLVVGNATQVAVEYNGKPVDLAPYTRAEVARFVLE